MAISTSGWRMPGAAARRAVAGLAMALALLAAEVTGARALPLGGGALAETAHAPAGNAPIWGVACQGEACGRGADQPPPCRERYAERWGGDPRYVKPRPPECGVRCMFDRMRNGFCGPGCDYYAFRMYEYEDGNVFHRKPCRY